MTTRTLYGRAFVGGEVRDETLVTLDGSTIAAIDYMAHRPDGAESFEGLLVPGFIDVHVHGGDGADFMDGSDEAVARVASFHARHGTTTMAATTLSASREDLHNAVEAIARVARSRVNRGAAIAGIHLEGPYINAKHAGAQDRASIRPADMHELAALIANAPELRWIVTVAPEIDGARAVIEHFKDRVLFSIGHTGGSYADAVAAVEWGAAHFTHLFNAMTPLHHREPGVVGAAFVEPDTTAELIADGVHVHRTVLRIAALGMPHRVALITDAVRACGMPDGNYRLYDHEFTVANGAARLADGTLAGSVLTMGRAVANMVELAGMPLESVIPMATEVPARILNVADRKGRIAAGYDADLVVLSERLTIERVLVRGEEIAHV